jgi:hypothetical protein
MLFGARAVFIASLGFVTLPALAESFTQSLRCSNGKLASVGDDSASVFLKCGAPMMKERNQTACSFGIRSSRCSLVEAWTYNPGSGKFLHTLIIEGGKVIAIRQGARVD